MNDFYSPGGNREVWDVKPEGYFTVEEWEAAHPAPPPPAPTVDDVKAEANRRISDAVPDWMLAREQLGGKAVSQERKAFAQAVREACAVLEAVDPIPNDFHDDKHWPAGLSGGDRT